MALAVRQAVTEDRMLAIIMLSFELRERCLAAMRVRSITMPGAMYPMGARAPILPTMPKEKARTLCTMLIIVAGKRPDILKAATTRNSREKLVPMPPGICRASVTRFAAGRMSFLAKSPRSQHKAMKMRCLNL